jgi:hypothetical protein
VDCTNLLQNKAQLPTVMNTVSMKWGEHRWKSCPCSYTKYVNREVSEESGLLRFWNIFQRPVL